MSKLNMQNQNTAVMLIGRFYPVMSGAEIQCLRLSMELNRAGSSAFVLTPKLAGTARHEIYQTVPVYRAGLALPGLLGSLSYFIFGLLWLLRNKNRYVVIHAHLASSTAVLAAIASFITGKPALVKFACSRKAGDIATSSATWYGRLKLRFLKRYIQAFVCPSAEIKEEMAQYGFQRSRITIIPNGIDTTDFKPATPQEKAMARAKLSLGPATFVAFYAGRLGPGKGVEYLIKAWKTNNTPGSVLYILGKGPGEYEYRNLSAGDNTIRFEGWKDNIRPYLLAADVFVLPSFAEGQPNSLIEAMACGLACIGADIGGINDMITNKVNGLLVAPGNISSLANALSFVLGNSGLRQQIGKAAREHVISHLSIEMIADKYREMYSNLTKGNSN